jgi:hypothetical protein
MIRSILLAGSALVSLIPALGATQTLDPAKTGMVVMFQDSASRLTAEAKESIEAVLKNCGNCDSEVKSDARNALSDLNQVLSDLENLKEFTTEVVDSCHRIIKTCLK